MQFFESLIYSRTGELNVNLDIESGGRDISFNKFIEYSNVAQLSAEGQKMFMNLIGSIAYVPYQRFKEALFEAFQQFADAIGTQRFSVIADFGDRTHFWLTALLWPQIRKLNVISVIKNIGEFPLQTFQGNPTEQPINVLLIKGYGSYIAVIARKAHAQTLGISDEDFDRLVTIHVVVPYGDKFSISGTTVRYARENIVQERPNSVNRNYYLVDRYNLMSDLSGFSNEQLYILENIFHIDSNRKYYYICDVPEK